MINIHILAKNKLSNEAATLYLQITNELAVFSKLTSSQRNVSSLWTVWPEVYGLKKILN